MFAQSLDREVKAVCPHIEGVSVGRKDDRATWRVEFKPQATEAERQAAEDVLARFVFTPQPASPIDALPAQATDLSPVVAILTDIQYRLDALELYATRHIHTDEDGRPMAFVDVGPDGEVRQVIADTRKPVDAA